MNLSKKIIIKTLLLNLLMQSFLFAASAGFPQNIIFIIVDGGGFNHLSALDYYETGKKKSLPFEKFPAALAVTTFPLGGSYDPEKALQDFNYVQTGLITDSAAAATALAAGRKTLNGMVGLDANGTKLENIVERCESLGMSTGIVTSVQMFHSTPACFAAHQQSRNDYDRIAQEMITQSGLEVLFGCGSPFFDDSGDKLIEFEAQRKKIWDLYIKPSADIWTIIQAKNDFLNLAQGRTHEKILGLAQAASTLQEKRKGISILPFDVPFNQNVPTLAQMTKAALNVLDDNNDGFFVMIEAGAVDWASHDNNPARMIEEMSDFRKMVDEVLEWVRTKSSWQKTLVVITADHETGFLSGPGKERQIVNRGKGNLPQMQWNSKNHTNSLVFFFAKGPGTQLFEQQTKGIDPVYGTYIDNTDIAKVIFTLLRQKSPASRNP